MSEMTNQLRRRELDTMTDQNQAVAALAEAMSSEKAGPTYCYYAEQAINAIAANPDIRREYGIGRLPTRSELMACREVDASTGYPVRVFGDDAVDYLVEAGWAIEDPDPQPPEPTLPTKQDLLHLLNSYESDLQSDRSGLRYRQDILTMFSALYAAAEAGRSQG